MPKDPNHTDLALATVPAWSLRLALVSVLASAALAACNRDTAGEAPRANDEPAAPSATQARGREEPGAPAGPRRTRLRRRGSTPAGPARSGTATTGAEDEPAATTTNTATAETQRARPRDPCPRFGDEVEIDFEALPGTAALVFTTAGDTAELQRRVVQLAQIYELHDSDPAMGSLPPSTAKVDNLAEGARLVLRPTEPDDLASLRRQLREHEARMETGACWRPTGPG